MPSSESPSPRDEGATERPGNAKSPGRAKSRNANSSRADERSWRELLQVWAPVILVAVAAFAYTFTKVEPPAPRHLVIAAGGLEGAYYGFAERYADILRSQGFELEVLETAGSMENLELLRAGEADLALLQGGVTDAQRSPGFESLGSVFVEPIWLFHQSELELERLTDLEGLRVNIGAEGSGTRALVAPFLAENGLEDSSEGDSEGSITLSELGTAEAVEALERGELDAAFFVASANAGYIRELLSSDSLGLMSIRRHRAYRVRYPFLSHVVLGEGVVDLDGNLPPHDISLVAAAATLSARSDLHHALVPVLVEAMETVHGGGGLFEEAGTFPSTRFVDLPVKAEAAHYIENGPSFLYRILPYRTATAVDRLKILLLPFIPILILVFKMAPPLYRWSIRSKIYRWYGDLRELDLLLMGDPDAEQVNEALRTVERLETEVAEVQVPLSYMDEFYNLRVHIGLVEQKLEELDQGPGRS